jgi:hypothetical protein
VANQAATPDDGWRFAGPSFHKTIDALSCDGAPTIFSRLTGKFFLQQRENSSGDPVSCTELGFGMSSEELRR